MNCPDHLPTLMTLTRSPERAALAALDVALHLATAAVRAANPELQTIGPNESPLDRMTAVGEVLLTQISATRAVLHRYEELDDEQDEIPY